MRRVVGYGMSHVAARLVCQPVGVATADLDAVERSGGFAQNERRTYKTLGLCAERDAMVCVGAGTNTYDAKTVTNPSGGSLIKGHPLGAAGMAQCLALTYPLR
jgi:acetyl-CoA acetyltransferase